MRHLATIAVLLLLGTTTSARERKTEREAMVKVECAGSSAFVNIQIDHYRRIGRVVLEVKDASGEVLYREEGRALADVLIRRLDKGVFPQGDLTLSVKARDMAITQVFTVK